MAARALRRLRHRRAGPRGAWSEELDLLLLADRRPAPWHTSVRIADDVSAAFPAHRPHPVLRLARGADEAAFAPGPTVDDRRLGAAVGDVWLEVRRLRRAIGRRTPWYRRCVGVVDPRPIWRR